MIDWIKAIDWIRKLIIFLDRFFVKFKKKDDGWVEVGKKYAGEGTLSIRLIPQKSDNSVILKPGEKFEWHERKPTLDDEFINKEDAEHVINFEKFKPEKSENSK